jgi:hypothetical protein
MNEAQAFAAVRNAIRLENISRDLAAKVAPELAMIFKSIRETLRTMPPGQLEREIRYKQLRMQLASMFTGANATFYSELRQGLDGEVLQQVEWAKNWIKIATNNNPEQELIASIPRDGVTLTPGTGGTAIGNYQFTRTQLVAITQKTEVLGKSLEEIFLPSDQMSAWIKDNVKLIDGTVKRGFLLGETNEEIANQLPGMGQLAVTRNRAIARTAVMDMSQRAHEEFWDANNSWSWTDPGTGEEHSGKIIQRWVFDATFDYRVCMQCAPWDGREVTERSRLPRTPIHPNCRCRVLPVTATELELRRSGESLTQTGDRSYVEISKTKPEGAKDVRVYKTKAKVNGKKFYKVAKEMKPKDGKSPSMADFLNRASPDTKIAVMGKENARRFVEMVKGTPGSKRKLTPDEALREIVKNPARRRK